MKSRRRKKRATRRYARAEPSRELRSRQTDPGEYADFRRVSWEQLSGSRRARGVSAILGSRRGFPKRYERGAAGSEIQSLRFDPRRFTRARARAWLLRHGFSPTLEGG